MASKRLTVTLPTINVPDTSPDLLPGEVLVAHCANTQQILYEASGTEHAPPLVSGTLYVTNHKMAFRPTTGQIDKFSVLDKLHIKSSEYIPLTAVLQSNIISSSNRKRLISSKATLPKKINELEIICKDMRKVTFNFKNCPKADAVNVVNTLGMYSCINVVYHLFAFDYARVVRSKRDTTDTSPSFLNARDWQKELDRLGVNQKQWRVTEANSHFLLCESLPPFLVVPYNISDDTLEYVASLHRDNRLPVWVWSHPTSGVSLMRGSLPDEDRLEAPDPSYLYAVSMARHLDVQVENKQVINYKMHEWCPATVRDIHNSYSKLMDVCLSGTSHDLDKTDHRWLLALDSSNWLYFIRCLLTLANDVVQTLCVKRASCLLLDYNDRDLSCIVSSLVQIMCDPHYRTISGFESLVQKEWVAMGHPFTTRLGLIVDQSVADENLTEGQSPIFLLFCDCVWQLTLQFPSSFQFSSTFLLNFISLTVYSIYGNFIFDSAKARLQASLHSKRSSYYSSPQDDLYSVSDLEQYEGPLISAWGNWRSSISAEENETWLNPYYYIFGMGDAQSDYTLTGSLVPLKSSHFNAVFSDMLPDKVVGGNFGLYSDQPFPVSLSNPDLSIAPSEGQDESHLLPRANVCCLAFWKMYFLRYVPEYSLMKTNEMSTRQLQSRLVKDVRKLQENLNDLEIEHGFQTSDLPRFIEEIMKAREEEKKLKKLKLQSSREITHRMSAFVSLSSEDEEAEHHRNHDNKFSSPDKARTLPAKLDESLSKFADELYNNGDIVKRREHLLTTSGGSSGRSPVLKTKITIQREDSNPGPMSPASRYMGSNQPAPLLHSPIMPSPPIPIHKKTSGLVEGTKDELTDLL